MEEITDKYPGTRVGSQVFGENKINKISILEQYIKEYYKPRLIRVMKQNGTYDYFEKSVSRSLDFQFYRFWKWLFK
jgi:hypothetical protein